MPFIFWPTSISTRRHTQGTLIVTSAGQATTTKDSPVGGRRGGRKVPASSCTWSRVAENPRCCTKLGATITASGLSTANRRWAARAFRQSRGSWNHGVAIRRKCRAVGNTRAWPGSQAPPATLLCRPFADPAPFPPPLSAGADPPLSSGQTRTAIATCQATLLPSLPRPLGLRQAAAKVAEGIAAVRRWLLLLCCGADHLSHVPRRA